MYTVNPDEVEFKNANTEIGITAPGPRTGLTVVDATTGQARFHPVKATTVPDTPRRNDFHWVTPDLLSSIGEPEGVGVGKTVSAKKAYHGLDGGSRSLPSGLVDHTSSDAGQAGLSPSGRLVTGPAGLPTKVTDKATGELVGNQSVFDLLAWADDENLVAYGCETACADEFRNGLVLVSVDGKNVTPLSAIREDGGSDTTWQPVLTSR